MNESSTSVVSKSFFGIYTLQSENSGLVPSGKSNRKIPKANYSFLSVDSGSINYGTIGRLVRIQESDQDWNFYRASQGVMKVDEEYDLNNHIYIFSFE